MNDEQRNESQFDEVLRKFDPELYLIHIALRETNVDPMILTHIIRALGNLNLGAGYGLVQIYVKAKLVTAIESTEKIKFKEERI